MPLRAPDLQTTFRDVMANVCTPVSVVTALTEDRAHGTTVSAFSSLSMSPPMVLVSLDNGSEVLALIKQTGRFGLNVLGSDQTGLAKTFAAKGPDKGNDLEWTLEGDVPRLPGTGGFLVCRVAELIRGGDHTVVLGDVVVAETGVHQPLTYHARRFGTHAPHP